jgi:hypothetical protein
MLVIDRLKALAAPPPDPALRQRLTESFSKGHADARNRMVQMPKDWDRIAKMRGWMTGTNRVFQANSVGFPRAILGLTLLKNPVAML